MHEDKLFISVINCSLNVLKWSRNCVRCDSSVGPVMVAPTVVWLQKHFLYLGSFFFDCAQHMLTNWSDCKPILLAIVKYMHKRLYFHHSVFFLCNNAGDVPTLSFFPKKSVICSRNFSGRNFIAQSRTSMALSLSKPDNTSCLALFWFSVRGKWAFQAFTPSTECYTSNWMFPFWVSVRIVPDSDNFLVICPKVLLKFRHLSASWLWLQGEKKLG